MIRGRVNAGALARLSRTLAEIPRVARREMKRELRTWGQDWEDVVRGRFSAGGESNLHNRTGFLRNSVGFQVIDGANALSLRASSRGVIYARIQEMGGVIRPVNARFLTIPMPANRTAGGDIRYKSARAFIATHPGETFFLRTPDGELLLMWRKPTQAARRSIGAKRGEAVALWRLVTKVEIPGPAAPNKRRASRFGFFDSWHNLAPKRRAGLARVAAAMRRAG